MGRWQDITDNVAKKVVRTFSSDVLYKPKASSFTTAIKAVFDEAFVSVQLIDGAPVQSVNPVMFVRLADLPGEPKRGDQATIRGKVYTVESFQPDGEAGAVLHLDEVEDE